MRKKGKIAIVAMVIIIFSMFFCKASFATKLGEENDGGVVVAIYKGKEYTALGVTVDALQNGEVLPWSKWTSGDLITMKNRCDNNNFGRHWDNEKQEFIEYSWYREFLKEFNGRKDIEVIGENNSTMIGDENSSEQANQKYKVTEDMTEEDKKDAEEYKKKNKETEEYKNYTVSEIVKYLEENDNKIPKNCYEKWKTTLTTAIDKEKNQDKKKKYIKILEEVFDVKYQTADGDIAIYNNPNIDRSSTSAGSLDDMIADADSFVDKGKKIQYEESALQNFSTILFNCFLAVGVALALIIGVIIGIKYMMGSVEEKANYKEMLVPYLVGCLVVFGAFGIWKMVVVMLESI